MSDWETQSVDGFPHIGHLGDTFTFTFLCTLIYFKQAKPTQIILSPWPLIKAKQRNDKYSSAEADVVLKSGASDD